MHASLLRLGLVPLPRVECAIEEVVVFLCTAMGKCLLHSRVRVAVVVAAAAIANGRAMKAKNQQ